MPNLFTALNLLCGFVCIISVVSGNFYGACLLVLAAAFFDCIDGRIARLTGTESPFGAQLDSIVDMVSFGMAPALLVYAHFFRHLEYWAIILTFLFALCGALRLARFNVNLERGNDGYFQGLPIPGAAVAIITPVILSLSFPQSHRTLFYTAIIIILIASLLMISNLPFLGLKRMHPMYGAASLAVFVFVEWVLLGTFMASIGFLIYFYIIYSLVAACFRRGGS